MTHPDRPLSLRSNEPDSAVQTILGAQRNNPYTIQMMAQAHNAVHGTTYSEMAVTDLYIKFTPNDYFEVVEVDESEIPWFDFPLDYEVLEMGDYYFNPSNPEEMPEMYAVVKPNEVLPNVPYTVLAELHLESTDTNVIKKAFEMTGNEWRVEGSPESSCNEGDPNYPYCLCQPGWVHWPDCFSEPDFDWGSWLGSGQGGGPQTMQNQCGCTVYVNQRKPGGCVRVLDSQLGLEGVRQVKVIWYNSWFTIKKTYTDDNGCWKIGNHEEAGKAYMWVKFQNPTGRYRGNAETMMPWQWYTTINYFVGKISGGVYNNVDVQFFRSNFSQMGRAWAAATVNNTLFDYHEKAQAEGITPPPPFLDVFVGRKSNYGYVLMPEALGPANMGIAIGQGLLNATFFNGEFTASIISSVAGSVGGGLASILFPDVHIGYSSGGPLPQPSDQFKSTAYHEFSHVSHFMEVGVQYWMDLIEHNINQNGYGTGGGPHPGQVACAEAWGYHRGPSMTDVEYGLNHSFTPPGTQLNIVIANRHINRLEGWESYRIESGFIPGGLFLDLIDDNLNQATGGFENGNVLNDDIKGYTDSQIFNELKTTTISMEVLKTRLKAIKPPGVTDQDIDDLFSDYGF